MGKSWKLTYRLLRCIGLQCSTTPQNGLIIKELYIAMNILEMLLVAVYFYIWYFVFVFNYSCIMVHISFVDVIFSRARNSLKPSNIFICCMLKYVCFLHILINKLNWTRSIQKCSNICSATRYELFIGIKKEKWRFFVIELE